MLSSNIDNHTKIIDLYRQEISETVWHCQKVWYIKGS
jgi:hypothetical protein